MCRERGWGPRSRRRYSGAGAVKEDACLVGCIHFVRARGLGACGGRWTGVSKAKQCRILNSLVCDKGRVEIKPVDNETLLKRGTG